MAIPLQSTVRNLLLKALPAESFARLSPHMTKADLPLRRVLVEADLPTTRVCFVESGLASVVATSPDDETAEVGHVGREGVSAWHLILGTDRTPHRTFMQAAGSGIFVPASVFLSSLDADVKMRSLFLRYVHSCEVQLAHSALANARYVMHRRLARWLLMCHDRLDGDDLALTHEFLAVMLGVRRAGVTGEIHVLEEMGAIKSMRANVRVLDRAKLEEIAGGCYGLPEREYERLIGCPIRRSRPAEH
jgi:CRP-like cAMP-binding protein